MKCSKCKQDQEETVSLSEYGNNKMGNKDTKQYCNSCFDTKYPRLHERIINEESN